MAATTAQDARLPRYLQDVISNEREESLRSQAGSGYPPTITLDLGSRGINTLPEEFFELVKNELERLALSHNQISSFPPSLAACSRLRYFNARHNNIRDFPPALLRLSSLEILDLSRNKLKTLPDEISSMKSLKVLAVSKNKIERLPVSLGDIDSLNMLKVDGNELSFPPPEVCKLKEGMPEPDTDSRRDIEITAQIKGYLRQMHATRSGHAGSGVGSSEGNVETPRPTKRKMSGRFLIKSSVNNTDIPNKLNSMSPNASQPPPIPSRSHYRDASKYGNGRRRPEIAPVNTSNERSRSNSEGPMVSAVRAKRMGLLGPKKPPAADSSYVNQPNGLYKSRGYGHLPLTTSDAARISSNDSPETMSPADGYARQSGQAVQVLDNSPKYKQKLPIVNTLLEGPKAIAYSLTQLQPYLQNVVHKARKAHLQGDTMDSLDQAFHAASSQVEELNRKLKTPEQLSIEDDDESRALRGDVVMRVCDAAIRKFEHLWHVLLLSINQVVSRSNKRNLRTLLLIVYGSIMELRNACSVLGATVSIVAGRLPIANPGDHNMTPTQARPQTSKRIRVATPGMDAAQSDLRYSKPERFSSRMSSGYRSTTITSTGIATPRSGRSFTPAAYSTPDPSNNASPRSDSLREERQFEKIVVKASVACTLATQIVPSCHYKFATCKNVAQSSMPPDSEVAQIWTNLCWQCDCLVEAAEALKTRLACIDLKDSTVRGQPDFWRLCTKFVAAWKNLVEDIRDIFQLRLVKEDIRQVLAPAAKAVKELAFVTANSKWRHLAKETGTPEMPNTVPPTVNTVLSNPVVVSGLTSPLPATPLSASLGPAVQATVPATPGQPPGAHGGFVLGPGVGTRERLQSVSSRR